ncbi:cofilin family protein [Streptomyces nojiriensis]|uniref:cofilin family protein n=1 Tax=Streptomyces nojiriensis TaxID=66374 RepID=UPI002E19AC33
MSSPTGLSDGSLAALDHLREKRDINTVTLRYADVPGLLVPEVEGNLTHEELVQALPADEPRLVVHELSFASPDGTRRHAQLLIFWLPPDTREWEEAYTDGFTALKEFLADVHVHLTARRADQLDYPRLVALAC